MPANAASHADLAARMVFGQTDQNGAYRSPALAPGKYHLVTSHVAPDTSPESVAKFWQRRSKAKEIEIGPSAAIEAALEPAAIE